MANYEQIGNKSFGKAANLIYFTKYWSNQDK